MKRGFVFSLLVGSMLAFLVLTVHYYTLERPVPDVSLEIEQSREMVTYHLMNEIAEGFHVSGTKGARMRMVEVRTASSLGVMKDLLDDWNSFLGIYQASTLHNASIDINGSTALNSGLLQLVSRDTNYEWSGDSFWLNHSGNWVLINNTVANVANTNCVLPTNGTTEVRVIVNNFDTGTKLITPGIAYSCFVNFSASQNMTIDFDTAGDVLIDYSDAPDAFTQRITFETNATGLQVVFDEANITTTGVDPGLTENFTGNKRYATTADYYFMLLDTDTDGTYDYMFVDENKDGDLEDPSDWRYVQEGIVELDGKAFYTWFELSGNWIMLDNALAVRSLSSWRGVVV